uniref:Reticulon-like protein n=1 Tax=Bursaphelenchus xylophilus TaxID=6326 RepID=A0A1I7RN95_BURXY
MSKVGLLFRAIGSLISLITRITFNLVHYVGLLGSLGVTVYTVGEYTHNFIKDKPRVLEILKWRDPKKSAAALALSLLALILIAKFSVISLIAWTSLTILAGTLGFRVYKLVESHLKKTDGANPFKEYLEPEISVPQEKAHAQADVIVQHGQDLLNSLRRLFLVENICDSIKFAVLLWTLTYIGSWFSGICLATLFVLALFTLPKVYELYQEPIDEYIALAKANVEKVNAVLQEKLPFLKCAAKDDKKEE